MAKWHMKSDFNLEFLIQLICFYLFLLILVYYEQIPTCTSALRLPLYMYWESYSLFSEVKSWLLVGIVFFNTVGWFFTIASLDKLFRPYTYNILKFSANDVFSRTITIVSNTCFCFLKALKSKLPSLISYHFLLLSLKQEDKW